MLDNKKTKSLDIDVNVKNGCIRVELDVEQADQYQRLLETGPGLKRLPTLATLAPVLITCPVRERGFGQPLGRIDCVEKRLMPWSGFYHSSRLVSNVGRAAAATLTVRMNTDISSVK